jgi:hypothetical protein
MITNETGNDSITNHSLTLNLKQNLLPHNLHYTEDQNIAKAVSLSLAGYIYRAAFIPD